MSVFTDPHRRPFGLPVRFRFLLCIALVSGSVLGLSGCQEDSGSGTATPSDDKGTETQITTVQSAPPVPDDDTDAVAALTEAGFILTKNDAGRVIECSMASDEDISESFAHLAGIPSTQVVRLSGPGINDTGLDALTNLTSLKRLDLTDSAITDDVLNHVSELTNLEVLILRRTGITDDGLAAISDLPKLRAIDLRNSNISDPGVEHLAKIKTLIDIQLEKSKVTDEGAAHLKGLPLKSINLNYCTSISNPTLEVLGGIPTLESIQLDYTSINDEGMPAVAKLNRLKRLRIRGTYIKSEGLRHIAELKTLERLELRDTPFDDEGSGNHRITSQRELSRSE